MLLGCSTKPQTLYVATPSDNYKPTGLTISDELLTYCTPLQGIKENIDVNAPKKEKLQQALTLHAENAAIISKCYLKQKGLVDEIKRLILLEEELNGQG